MLDNKVNYSTISMIFKTETNVALRVIRLLSITLNITLNITLSITLSITMSFF